MPLFLFLSFCTKTVEYLTKSVIVELTIKQVGDVMCNYLKEDYVYLLGQAYDCFNYTLAEDKTAIVNYFAKSNELDQQIMNDFYDLSLKLQENPVWLMSSVFDYYLYLNRKRKTIPFMPLGNFNQEMILKAYDGKDKYRKLANINLYVTLDNLYLKALNMLFKIPIKELYSEEKTYLKERVFSYRNTSYINVSMEKVRRLLLKRSNKTWDNMLLLDGVEYFEPVIFLICKEPHEALNNHLGVTEYSYYYYGINNEIELRDPDELKYLFNAYHYLNQRGLII